MAATTHSGSLGRLGLALFAVLLGAALARAAPTAGVVVPISAKNLPEVRGTVLAAIEAPLKAFEARRQEQGDPGVFKIICDFNPDGLPNKSDDFGACYELAERLRDLQKRGVRTIAFVHGDVSRHSVLPVLACSEVVLSRQPLGVLGPVGDIPADKVVQRQAYETIAAGRYPLALVRKLFDPAVEVIEAQRPLTGDPFRDGREVPRPAGKPVPDLGPGTLASYTADKAFGLAETRNTLQEVLQAYDLPASALRQAPVNPVVYRTVLTGPINGETREKMERRLRYARDQKATVLIVELACGDGDAKAAHHVAMQLVELSALDEPIFTIAYVKPAARNLATVLAFACDRIVMHPQAKLGDFEGFLQALAGEPKKLEQKQAEQDGLAKDLAAVAERKLYPTVIAQGMLDRKLRIRWVKSVKGEGGKQFLEDGDFLAKGGPNRWQTIQMVKPADEKDVHQLLTLNAEQAVRFGLAESIAVNADEIADRAGVARGQVKSLDNDLLERIADFLRDPWTSYILILVGVTCLIIELKLPGVTMPGVIAAVCFVLYFWSHSQFNGQILWLALLLFLLGICLLAIELFVLPGFGFCGVGGIVCILAALSLLALGRVPNTEGDWTDLGGRMGYLLLGMFLAVIAAALIVRYVPHLPIVNQLLLHPAESADEGGHGAGLDGDDAEELLGAIGVAATPLRPSGKMQIGDRFLDVVAEGGYIVPGTRVQIVEIEGNRVVVKEI